MVAGVEYRNIRAVAAMGLFPIDVIALAPELVLRLARLDGAPQDVYRFVEPGTPVTGPVFNGEKYVWLRSLELDEDTAWEFGRIRDEMRPLAGSDTPESVSEMTIFGSGCIGEHSWWVGTEHVGGWDHVGPHKTDAPDGWVIRVTAVDPDDEDETVTVLISHEKLMHAARRIIDGTAGDRISASTEREAAMLVYSPEYCDFDAAAADELLQIAVYGDVVYS